MSHPAPIPASFLAQAASCRALGSPFTAHLCEILAHDLDRADAFGRRILDWPGDPDADALALRACGSLQARVLAGEAPALAALWPPHGGSGTDLAEALRRCRADPAVADRLAAGLDGAPQTNEVGRSAVLLGGALIVAAETGLPLELLEIGAAAGFNLLFDHHVYDLGVGAWGAGDARVHLTCDWRGFRPPLDAPLVVLDRAGCDLAPIDPTDSADRDRLLAYVWADQDDRRRRALDAFDAVAAAGLRIERADAADWLEDRLARPARPGRTRVVMHSIVRQYLPEATRARIDATLAHAGDRATAETPLAHLAMENDGSRETAAVTLTLWPGGETVEIGRADFHGRQIAWRAGAVSHARDGA